MKRTEARRTLSSHSFVGSKPCFSFSCFERRVVERPHALVGQRGRGEEDAGQEGGAAGGMALHVGVSFETAHHKRICVRAVVASSNRLDQAARPPGGGATEAEPMRSGVLVLLVVAHGRAGRGHRPRAVAADGEARPPRPSLGGDHRQAARRHRRRARVREGRQRRGRRVRHARRRLHDVGHARLGRRDAGPRLRPPHEEGDRHQRPRRRADRGDAGLLQGEGSRLPAGVRAARRRDPGDSRRPHHDALRVRPLEPERRARAGDPDGRRLPDRGPARERARAGEEAALRLALLEGGVPPPRRRGARGAGGGRGVRPEGPRGDPAEAGRGGADGSRRGQEPQGGAPGRPRPLLPRRHRPGARPRHAGAGRAHHGGRPRPLAGEAGGAGQDHVQGHRRLQAHGLDAGPGDAPGPQRPRERRPEVDGV